MVATIPQPVTVEEFLKRPIEEGEVYYELHHGEVVSYFRPKHKHVRAQRNLLVLVVQAAGGRGVVWPDFWFQALPEYEFRAADVVYISQERWDALDPEGMFHGVPEIVIEVLSPSNTVLDMLDKEQLCLENGAKEFWLVNLDRRQVKVSTPDGLTITYHAGQNIPIALFDGAQIAVDAIFA